MSTMQTLQSEVVTTAAETDYTVIWLHGLGADGHDFVPIIPELKLPSSLRVRFVFPHAPVRAVTLNNGMQMRAWYDLLSLDRANNCHESDILTTVSWITKMLDDEIAAGRPANKILLAGFSQGGVIALHTALRYPQRLAGIMALSTYMPFADELLAQANSEQNGLAIFAAHGQHDPVIPLASWQTYAPALETAGYEVSAHSYMMEHSVCLEEINDISAWLQQTLA